tara:strand:+ start:184 stop:588 length:405 start_codon:yes stop_codon:yes gene_type:complete
MNNLFKFHHFGLALKNLEDAKKFYSSIGYKLSKKYNDRNQKINLILCTSKNMPTIELIAAYSKMSPISQYLEKLNEIFYHSCYEIKNPKAIIFLKDKFNAKCISSRKKSVLFDKKVVSFYYLKNIGLLEIIEKK